MTNYQINDNQTPSKQKGLPLRYFVLFNSFFAFIIVYANKVVLSVAIVAMVRDQSFDHRSQINGSLINSSTINVPPSFQALHSGSENNLHLNLNSNLTTSKQLLKEPEHIIKHPHYITELKSNQVEYDVKTKSKVLGAFFWGYIVTQVPAGRLAERYGAKHILGFSMFLCSLMSLIIPVATLSETEFTNSRSNVVRSINNFMFSIMGSAWALQLIRMAQGVCAGVAHPCMHALITRWTPKNERSMTTAFIYSGSQIGTVIIMPVTGFLASSTFLDGWPSVFYLLGALGTVWFILWCIFVYDTPDKHPFISKEELDKLKIGIGNEIDHDNREIPWGKVFTSWPVYALIAAHFGQNFGYFMLLTELPTYLKEGLGYDIKSNGVISSVPYLVQAVTSWISSYASDRIVASDVMPLSWVRKGFNSVGFFGPAICFVVIAFAGYSRSIVILSLIFSLALNGFAMSGFHVTHVDMAPSYAGTLMGITNGISNFNGIIAPFIVTALTDDTNTTEWWAVFLIGCAVYVVTNLIYCWLGTSKLQTWAQSSNDKEVHSVYVCDSSYQNGKKDAYLLTDLKKDQHVLNTTIPELKTELLNSKN